MVSLFAALDFMNHRNGVADLFQAVCQQHNREPDVRDRLALAGCKHSTKWRERQQPLQPAHSLPSPH